MMKKSFFISLLILILTFAAFSQSKSNEQIEKQIKNLNVEKSINLVYDEAGGTTKIIAFGKDFGRDADKRARVQGFSFGIAFLYAGKTLKAAPNELNLTFWVQTKKPQFAQSHHLTVFAGNETLDLGDARYSVRSGEEMEYLNFKIPRETFTKIANASDAKIKIGSAEFKLTPEHLKLFAAMVKISDPLIL